MPLLKFHVVGVAWHYFYIQVVFEGISGLDIHSYIAVDNIKFVGCGKYAAFFS